MSEVLQLEQVRLTHVRVPLHEPFAISNGVVSEKDAIVVELQGDGLTGIGEASPMAGAFYSHQTPESSWDALVSTLVPGLRRAGIAGLSGRWYEGLVDDPFAVSGMETALWDLVARARGVPLWRLFQEAAAPNRDAVPPEARSHVDSGLAVGIFPRPEDLLQRIEHYLQADGYKRVKIKVQPGWDVGPLAAIRAEYPDLPLIVDANCAYGRGHIEHIATWDRFGLMMIEQPLPREDLEGHALLAARCNTPICLDEGAESVGAVERAIRLRAARIVNIKLQRLGTMTAALRVHAITQAAGVGCWLGTMPELAIGGWAAVHFATLPNIVYPTDVESSDRWFVADITDPPIRCQGGLIPVPTGPGLGVSLDRDVMERYRVRESTAALKCEVRIAT